MLVIVLCSLDILRLHENCLVFLTFVPKEIPRSRQKLINYANVLAIRFEQTID